MKNRHPDFPCLPCCGQCCGGHIKFTQSLVDLMRDRFQVEVMLEVVNPDGKVQLFTTDGYCIFLNRETVRCVIYGVRPPTCREYGSAKQPCPYIRPDGTPRSQEEIAGYRRSVDKLVSYYGQTIGKNKV